MARLQTCKHPKLANHSNIPQSHGPTPPRTYHIVKLTRNRPPSVLRAAKLPPKTTPTHVFFFGYEGPEPENTFQQWYPSPFKDADGTKFLTTEHYMMYHKALLMSDSSTADKILASSTPAEAKSLGREVKGFNQKLWDEKCDGIVEQGNFLKFSQVENCRKALLATGERKLIEASPNDRVWGIGFAADEAEGKEEEWGANKLGEALERVRQRIGKGDESFVNVN